MGDDETQEGQDREYERIVRLFCCRVPCTGLNMWQLPG